MKKELSLLLMFISMCLFIGGSITVNAEEVIETECTGYAVLPEEGEAPDNSEITFADDLDPKSVYNRMIALKDDYPEGMPWTNDNFYAWRGGYYSGGYGCAGFAFLLSDAAFGDLPARFLEEKDFAGIRVGDILRINNDTHSVIVLEVYSDYVVIAEGNYNRSIHWGRRLSKSSLEGGTLTYIMTRYPVEYKNILVEKIELPETESLYVSDTKQLNAVVSPGNATNQNLTWKTSNDKVVAVDANGVVTAVGPGSAIITATAQDGSGVSASCVVTTSVENDNPFYDVHSTEWYYPYVKKAYEKGLMVGTSTHEQTGLIIFKPETYMTRSMFVQVLYSMEGKPKVTYKNVFSDIPDPSKDSGAWYSYAVLWAAENGITSGKPDGTFGVNSLVTREEMALMLMKYAKMKNYDVSGRADISGFPDEASVSDWAREAMQWAVYNGVIAGKPAEGGNILKPQGNAWRAEGATMLSSFHEKFE